MPSLLEHLSRLRHSRGFGVHSPWAYEIVRDVLPEKCAYYAYHDINRVFGDEARLARMVFRLLVHLHPHEILVTRQRHWVRLARQVGTHGPGGKVFLVTAPEEFHGWRDCETLVFTCLDTPEGREAWQNALHEVQGTVIDTHRRLGIMSRRKGLPAQTIHMRTLFNDQ